MSNDLNNHLVAQQELVTSYTKTENYLSKAFLNELTDYPVISLPTTIKNISTRGNIRFFKVEKIIYDSNENISEKLLNVFNSVGSLGSSLVLVIDADKTGTNLYLGVKSQKIIPAQAGLNKSFLGNFPGSTLDTLGNEAIGNLLTKVLNGNRDQDRTIASVSGIPALKNIDKDDYIQGLEKLISAMSGEVYSVLMIADPISNQQLPVIRQGYEELYSNLSPFKTQTLSMTENETQGVMASLAHGVNETTTHSINKTQSFTQGQSVSKTLSNSKTIGVSHQTSGGVSLGIPGTPVGVGVSKSISKTESTTSTTSRTKGSNQSRTNAMGTSDSQSEGTNLTNTRGTNSSVGTAKTLQMEFTNKTIDELLVNVDRQIDRLDCAEDLGLWNYSCYVLSEDSVTTQVVATNYQSLIRGDDSAVEGSAVNIWQPDMAGYNVIRSYLNKLSQPLFKISSKEDPLVTTGTLINTRELAVAFGLPRKSVDGLIVYEMPEFGRNVTYLNKKNDITSSSVKLGQIYYMGKVMDNTPVSLDLESLAMHTLIAGSTGAGKSNTAYQLIQELIKENKKFMVIEPAKGEYKNILGGRRGVKTFGTNSQYSPLLKINPFRFPEDIHVLEHIDRLIEIFNACWPMYAAMPAILKESVEKVYEKCGWDLATSSHFEATKRYPTLQDLVLELPRVIDSSNYSQEVKSNYIGSLVTRVKSLTNGLTGPMFLGEEIDNQVLFDCNVIIDLSRIGSSETKSLLMGILFMRLQEHRLSQGSEANSGLKHVTILEEAHHLLRKTSSSQGDDTANLQGKSVEMLTNAIAEMRTYGEGFIIADQSPSSLDPAAIRNTNTKIIMRLPEAEDRLAVGSSISLTDAQKEEMTRLESGVAIVYQNNWVESVLCKVTHFTKEQEKPLNYEYDAKKSQRDQRTNLTMLLKKLLVEDYTSSLEPEILQTLEELPLTRASKDLIKNSRYFKQESKIDLNMAQTVTAIIQGEKLLSYAMDLVSVEQFDHKMRLALGHFIEETDQQFTSLIIDYIYQAYIADHPNFKNNYIAWKETCLNKTL